MLKSKTPPPDIKLVATDVDGVLTDSGMYFSHRGEEFKRFSTRDGMGFGLLRNAGIRTAIITSEHSGIVRARAAKLAVDFVYLGAKKKGDTIKRLVVESKIKPEQMAYLGDDINDLPAIRLVGFSAAPSDAVNAVKREVDLVLESKGGYGAFRELADLVLLERSDTFPG